jgi:hypothetical protein
VNLHRSRENHTCTNLPQPLQRRAEPLHICGAVERERLTLEGEEEVLPDATSAGGSRAAACCNRDSLLNEQEVRTQKGAGAGFLGQSGEL